MSILDQLQEEAKEQNKPLDKVINRFVLDFLFDADFAQTSLLAQELRNQMFIENL